MPLLLPMTLALFLPLLLLLLVMLLLTAVANAAAVTTPAAAHPAAGHACSSPDAAGGAHGLGNGLVPLGSLAWGADAAAVVLVAEAPPLPWLPCWLAAALAPVVAFSRGSWACNDNEIQGPGHVQRSDALAKGSLVGTLGE